MGYREEYVKAREAIDEGNPIWIPKVKTVVFPPHFLIWLETFDPKLCIARNASPHNMAQYVVTQKLGNHISVELATDSDLTGYAEEIVKKGAEFAKSLPEPYRTKLMAVLTGIV